MSYLRRCRWPKVGLFIVIAASFTTLPLVGQGTDAAIRGTVTDSMGVPLPGARIEVRNEASSFVAQLTTGTQGHYVARQLPLGGPYRVTVHALGFRAVARDGLTLNIGNVVTADFRLSRIAMQLQEVSVTTEPARVIERNGAATRIGEAQLEQLPNQNRRFQDLAKLSPLAGSGVSLGGSRPMSTDVRIDGVGAQMNNTGQTFAGPLTMTVEAIREFEIVTNEYDVSKGRQGGGLINAVTKSGTNAFTGTAFSYYRDQRLTTEDLRGVPPTDFKIRQQGLSIGGPILKDRLHFFTVYDRTDQSLPFEVTNVRDAADEIELGIARDSLARLTSILAGKYGLDTTRRQLGVFSRKPLSQAFFGRIDWQMTARHRLTLRNNTTLYSDPQEIGPDQTLHYFETRGAAKVNSYGTFLSVRSAFRPTVINEFKLQALKFTRERIAQNNCRAASSRQPPGPRALHRAPVPACQHDLLEPGEPDVYGGDRQYRHAHRPLPPHRAARPVRVRQPGAARRAHAGAVQPAGASAGRRNDGRVHGRRPVGLRAVGVDAHQRRHRLGGPPP